MPDEEYVEKVMVAEGDGSSHSGDVSLETIPGEEEKPVLGEVFYATCSTASATAAKVAAIVSDQDKVFKLEASIIVVVKFTNTNIATGCTLNINGTGAKSVVYSDSTTIKNKSVFGVANKYTTYMYDGSNWVWIGHSYDTVYSAYAICNDGSASSSQVKIVTIDNPDWRLESGCIIHVFFEAISDNTYDSTTTNPAKLNVNGSGEIAIVKSDGNNTLGYATGTDKYILGWGNHIISYMYNGTYWVWLSVDDYLWKRNTKTSEGYVITPPLVGNANLVWGTDANGNPGWRQESGGGTTDLFNCTTNGLMPMGGGSSQNANKNIFNDGVWSWVENQIVDFSPTSSSSLLSINTLSSHTSLSTLFNDISRAVSNCAVYYSTGYQSLSAYVNGKYVYAYVNRTGPFVMLNLNGSNGTSGANTSFTTYSLGTLSNEFKPKQTISGMTPAMNSGNVVGIVRLIVSTDGSVDLGIKASQNTELRFNLFWISSYY